MGRLKDKTKHVGRKKKLSDSDTVIRMAEMFKTLSDPARIRIIEALSSNELCVRELAEVVGLTQSAMSHQLRLLRNTNIVRYRKEGKTCRYRLDDEHVADLMRAVQRHASHTKRGR